MMKLTNVMLLGLLLVGLSGCRIGECWREAWNSRRCPPQTVVVTEPVVMTDVCCDPCGSPCGTPCVVPSSPCCAPAPAATMTAPVLSPGPAAGG